MIGRRISHFEILSELGAGGMGRVYLARDLHLDRKVALKFLSEDLIGDKEAQARFLREARSASALDHDHIGTIYEAGEIDDLLYIAMAYYEGETLRERIARGQVPLDEAISILRQMAAGLAAAHETGIAHRDIKPANVMLTEGMVKILDLAGLVDGADVVMVEGAGGSRFAEETSLSLVVADQVLGEELQGDLAIEVEVAGEVDAAHAAGTELGEDLEVGDAAADHGFKSPPPLSSRP